MSLLESRLNSIAAIAIDAALNNASVDFLTNNYYNKSTLLTILNSKQQNIIQAPATITLGQSADYTYFVDADSKSYPLFSSPDIVWNKQNNNISLNVSNEFKSAYLTTTAASSLYAHAEDVANFETAVSMLGDVYQTITGMSSYVTTGTLINNYATQLELSDKVDYTFFEQQLNIASASAVQNSYAYTDDKLTNYITSFTPLSGTYLSIINADTTYQRVGNYLTDSSVFQLSGHYLTNASLFQLSGNYLTDGSVFQLSGNYLTNASLFQLSGNYLTDSSVFQLSGNYLTDSSVFQLSGNYLTNASLFQLSGNYLTNASLFQLSGNYLTNASLFQASGNYLTNASLFQLSGNYLTNASLFQASGNYLTNASLFQLSGNYLTNASLFQLSGNYLTNASLFQLSGDYITTLTPLSGTYLSILNAGSTYQAIANMSSYITSGSLTNYITSGSLTNYVTSASITNTLGSYLTTSIASSSYMPKPWVGGWFQVSTMNVIKQIGTTNFSVVRTSGYAAGSFDISFGSHPSGGSYVIFVTPRLSSGVPIVYGYGGVITSTGFTVRFSNLAGTNIDAEFNLIIPPN